MVLDASGKIQYLEFAKSVVESTTCLFSETDKPTEKSQGVIHLSEPTFTDVQMNWLLSHGIKLYRPR